MEIRHTHANPELWCVTDACISFRVDARLDRNFKIDCFSSHSNPKQSMMSLPIATLPSGSWV